MLRSRTKRLNTRTERRPSASILSVIRKTLAEMCRPFGIIRHWTVEIIKDGLYRCRVRLKEPEQQRLAAQTLGGVLLNDEICLEIRVR